MMGNIIIYLVFFGGRFIKLLYFLGKLLCRYFFGGGGGKLLGGEVLNNIGCWYFKFVLMVRMIV